MCCVLKMLKFTYVKMSDMPCVSVCVLFGVQVETDNNVFCNIRHPENGLMGPKHVGA